jgi:hypothetical protein
MLHGFPAVGAPLAIRLGVADDLETTGGKQHFLVGGHRMIPEFASILRDD